MKLKIGSQNKIMITIIVDTFFGNIQKEVDIRIFTFKLQKVMKTQIIRKFGETNVKDQKV